MQMLPEVASMNIKEISKGTLNTHIINEKARNPQGFNKISSTCENWEGVCICSF